MSKETSTEALWREILTSDAGHRRRTRHLFRLLPTGPRCKLCLSPFGSPGGLMMRVIGRQQSNRNPHFCDYCERFAVDHPGGAEIALALVYADVRGSTTLAEQMRPAEFSALMRRFYIAATEVLLRNEALIDKLVGDAVFGIFLPAFAGPDYVWRAVQAGQGLLEATGHTDPDGPWLPLGVGVHAGVAYMGTFVGSEGVTDVTAVGDTVNIVARLASLAAAGELLVAQPVVAATGLDIDGFEQRRLEVRGRSEPVDVVVIPAGSAPLRFPSETASDGRR